MKNIHVINYVLLYFVRLKYVPYVMLHDISNSYQHINHSYSRLEKSVDDWGGGGGAKIFEHEIFVHQSNKFTNTNIHIHVKSIYIH